MRWFPVALAGVLLTACESGPFGWLGEPSPSALEGERVAVLELDTGISADLGVTDAPLDLPAPVVNADWPQHGGDATKAMHHLSAPGSLDIVWRRSIGAGEGAYRKLVATPVVADGRIMTFDADTGVSAFDAVAGNRLWTFDTTPGHEDDGGWGGGLAHGDGMLYVTTGFGEAIALDPGTGAQIWRAAIGPPVRTPPAVSEGRVHVVASNNELVTLDAQTGEVLWIQQGIAETVSLLGGGSPAVSGSFVVAAFSSGEVHALRAENGRVVWTDSLAHAEQTGSLAALNDINGSPVIDRDIVLVLGHSGRLVAVDLATGVRLWERPLTGTQTPWVAGNHVFAVTVDGHVVCLLREDGRIRWVASLPAFEDIEEREDPIAWSGPVLAGGRLVVVGNNGVAAIVSPYTGEIMEMRVLGGAFPLAPVVAGETVYLVNASGDLSALR